jgi:hypothetical protein
MEFGIHYFTISFDDVVHYPWVVVGVCFGNKTDEIIVFFPVKIGGCPFAQRSVDWTTCGLRCHWIVPLLTPNNFPIIDTGTTGRC